MMLVDMTIKLCYFFDLKKCGMNVGNLLVKCRTEFEHSYEKAE